MDHIELNASFRNTHYKIQLKRRVTVLRGETSSGKTKLVNIIQAVNNGISEYKCSTSTGNAVRTLTADALRVADYTKLQNSVIVLDEACISTLGYELKDIIEVVPAYWLLITRTNTVLKTVPYSSLELYKLCSVDNTLVNSPLIDIPSNRIMKGISTVFTVDSVIAEDSGSGNYFFSKALPKARFCIGAGGNGNIRTTVLNNLNTTCGCFVCFDDAAFGPLIEDFLKLCRLPEYKEGRLCFYFMESFEWFLLHSKNFRRNKAVQDWVANPETVPLNGKYVTHENFYEDILRKLCNELYMPYSKSYEDHPLYTKDNMIYLLSLIPDTDFSKVQIDTDMTESLNDLLKKHS